MLRVLRKYEPVWELIKKDGECTISAPTQLHARIKKAVCKEKYGDFGYKLHWELQEAPQPELSIIVPDPKTAPHILKFILIKPTLLGDL